MVKSFGFSHLRHLNLLNIFTKPTTTETFYNPSGAVVYFNLIYIL